MDYGLPYNEFPTFTAAWVSMFRYLGAMSKQEQPELSQEMRLKRE